jgi:hypothetical protein
VLWFRHQAARNRLLSVSHRKHPTPQHSTSTAFALQPVGVMDAQLIRGRPRCRTLPHMTRPEDRCRSVAMGRSNEVPTGTCISIYSRISKLIQLGPSQDEVDQYIQHLIFCSRADNVREGDSPKLNDEDRQTIADAYHAAKRQIRLFESRWRLEGQRWVPQFSAVAHSSVAGSAQRRASSIPGRERQSQIPVSMSRKIGSST